MKRRHFLGASTALLASSPIRSLAQGHGPADDLLPPISVTAPTELALPIATPNGPAGGYHWAINGDNIRGGIFQIGKFRLVNGKKILEAAAAGRSRDVLYEFGYGMELASKQVVQAQISTYALFTSWIADMGWQGITGATQYGLSDTTFSGLTTAFGLFSDYYFSYLPAPPIESFKFYATPFFTLSAYYNWIRGNGEPKSVDLKSLRLGIGVQQISPIRDIIVNDAMGPGTYRIDAQFSTNLLSNQELIVGSALGRVSGHIQGELFLGSDDSFYFRGEYTLNPDKFDFDASRSRPSIQEALTTFVRKIGEFTDHKDFMIYFTGSQPLNVNGTRASIKAMNPDGTPAAVHSARPGGFGRRP
ncbi:lipid II-degrading bacteriocin [Burkholderia cenocepacia]|uniref:lipid II-degrading bacteriocin n=1 Tax=Burkholderia cenocepacia TaxID=95486 RepID=UPI000F5815C7|nr:lipid II-degrading bacteriocin [Burkholderia cenocepacia]RQV32100.1 lipid II-degrading bacteriocin [Burkholderia cenocepacia]RQV35910.1 lipid II-degrading bacteriocin [Burkholderia cenocepacia]RQV75513.1 lipid II-degrading bacteriocin [Burkholderia cenocepacia]